MSVLPSRYWSKREPGVSNVRSKADAAWIYRNTPVGAKVVVF